MLIKDYPQYVHCIKDCEFYSNDEHELLKDWCRKYYAQQGKLSNVDIESIMLQVLTKKYRDYENINRIRKSTSICLKFMFEYSRAILVGKYV